MVKRWVSAWAMAATLAGCGGGGDGATSGGTFTASSGTATPTPTATTGTCSLLDRKAWAFAQLQEWYLFPDTLPGSLDPTNAGQTIDAYIDAATATARSQRKDRFFTYLTSIAAENAFYNSGSSAGFGVRLTTDAAAGRVFIAEAFEGTPALAAGIDRGTEILAIGTSANDLRTVGSIIAAEGTAGVTNALGPNIAGTTRLLRITDAAGTRNVNVTKADYELTPVSARYGAKVITDGGKQYGYINLRTFINTADTPLRNAFAQFKAAGITNVIIDFRYNGGGLVSISEEIGDLLGAARSTGNVLDYTTFRASKASNNSTRFFAPQPQSIAPTKIAFIGTGGTASASELTINAQIPYLGANVGLIGTNTFGKPVGQIALDRAACDDRLRVIAFATQNANRVGDYYDGLAAVVQASCQATDDLSKPLGDPQEASTRAALNYLQGVSCTRISSGEVTAQSAGNARRDLLTPDRPTPTQRETPGSF